MMSCTRLLSDTKSIRNRSQSGIISTVWCFVLSAMRVVSSNVWVIGRCKLAWPRERNIPKEQRYWIEQEIDRDPDSAADSVVIVI